MLEIDEDFITFSSGHIIPSWSGIQVAWRDNPINPDQACMQFIPYDHTPLTPQDINELAEYMIEFWEKRRDAS